jgi:DNA-binding NarL/FixJ family response regulator
MANPEAVPTIVVSRPGVMRQALRASLSVCPSILVIFSAGDGLTALNQTVSLQPALVVIDANLLSDEAEALLLAIKARQSPPRCLVFIQSSRHEHQMLAAGADVVMLRDSPADELQAVLLRLAQAHK